MGLDLPVFAVVNRQLLRHPGLLLTAAAVAEQAHKGQIEKYSGEPYIKHVERVEALVSTDDEKTVACLHDVVEDTNVTLRDLARLGIPDGILDAVELLTRPSKCPLTYENYIDRLVESGNKLALTVKLADLRDHLREGCLGHLIERYILAFKTVEAALSKCA